jgi:hypothetical protein
MVWVLVAVGIKFNSTIGCNFNLDDNAKVYKTAAACEKAKERNYNGNKDKYDFLKIRCVPSKLG